MIGVFWRTAAGQVWTTAGQGAGAAVAILPRARWRWPILWALAGWGCAAAAAQGALHDDRGQALATAPIPQRIVSLLPSLTESVCALGACERLIGTDRFSNWPASVMSLPKLGDLDNAPVERIVALHPDLVLVSTSARLADRLQALGLRVVALDSRSHDDVHRSLDVLAELLGRPQAATTLWSTIEQQTRDAARRVPVGLRGLRVYFEVDPTPYAAGAHSYLGETLAQLGVANAVPSELGPFPKLNPEYVVRLQPDIVMGAQADVQHMSLRPGWKVLRALSGRRSCGFDAAHYELLLRPGPRMGQAAGVLADCLVAMDPVGGAP